MKLILCRGVFDILHVGHHRYLREAADMGDMLVVTVTQDRFVNKGPGRPMFPLDERIEAIRDLWYVDHVCAGVGPTAVSDIYFWQPALFVKGPACRSERSRGLFQEIKAVRDIGGDIAYTNGAIHSSSELAKKVLSYG